MQAAFETATFRQQARMPKGYPSVAIHSPAEESRRRARDATAKSAVATNLQDRQSWLQAADRWRRLAEDIDHGQLQLIPTLRHDLKGAAH